MIEESVDEEAQWEGSLGYGQMCNDVEDLW